jgi:hypothetical protein
MRVEYLCSLAWLAPLAVDYAVFYRCYMGKDGFQSSIATDKQNELTFDST